MSTRVPPAEPALSSKADLTTNLERGDEAQERVLLRKMDVLLMPLLTISYGLQFYDKFVFSSAAVYGMLADLHLSVPIPGTKLADTRRYSTATAAFYWGYLVGVIPMALLLRRFPVAKTLSFCIFVWGVLAMSTAALSSFSGAVALRFFLGFIESSVSPGFVIITTSWYRPSELPVRLGIWYSATGIFTVFSGTVNYAIGSNLHGSLAPWKWMYIIAGAITIGWSVILVVLLPDGPVGAPRWLFSEKEVQMLEERQRVHLGGPKHIEWGQVKEALLDPKVWVMAAMGAAIYVCNGGVTAFGSLIIKSFGYTSLQSILLQAPGGATTCLSIYIVTLLVRPRRITDRPFMPYHLVLALSCLPVLIGAIILWKGPPYTHARGAALAGYYLLPTFGAPYVILLALVSRNIAGRTKKAVGAGALFVGYCVGNILGPYLVNTSQAPIKYRTTWISIIVVMVLTMVLSLGLWAALARENDRRDSLQEHIRAGASAHTTEKHHEYRSNEHRDTEERQATDSKDIAFHYVL